MQQLISTLVPPRQQTAARQLLDDPDSRNLIRQQISQLAEDHTGIIPQDSLSWILCKLTTFGAKESDTFRIYQAFISQLNQLGQMCRQFSGDGNHWKYDSPTEVASRITIGLGLFPEQAARLHQYHAAPSPRYYQKLAANCFAVTGYTTIAANLPRWLDFIRTNFALPKL